MRKQLTKQRIVDLEQRIFDLQYEAYLADQGEENVSYDELEEWYYKEVGVLKRTLQQFKEEV